MPHGKSQPGSKPELDGRGHHGRVPIHEDAVVMVSQRVPLATLMPLPLHVLGEVDDVTHPEQHLRAARSPRQPLKN